MRFGCPAHHKRQIRTISFVQVQPAGSKFRPFDRIILVKKFDDLAGFHRISFSDSALDAGLMHVDSVRVEFGDETGGMLLNTFPFFVGDTRHVNVPVADGIQASSVHRTHEGSALEGSFGVYRRQCLEHEHRNTDRDSCCHGPCPRIGSAGHVGDFDSWLYYCAGSLNVDLWRSSSVLDVVSDAMIDDRRFVRVRVLSFVCKIYLPSMHLLLSLRLLPYEYDMDEVIVLVFTVPVPVVLDRNNLTRSVGCGSLLILVLILCTGKLLR
mmetsp:Transcript_24316/g.57406  ORF Transcript_24316/g.57406 Transcript_24316/m.57406 type:complete len:267 (-) Transcript_24316:26-826(-)